MLLLEELQLLRATAPGLHQARDADVAEDALDGLRRDPHLVNPLEPDPRAACAELLLESRLRDQRHDVLADAASPPGGVLRHQSLDARPLPIAPPLPDGGPGQPKLPARRLDAVLPDELDDRQSLLHPQPISGRNLRGPFHRPSCEGAPLVEAPGLGLVLK